MTPMQRVSAPGPTSDVGHIFENARVVTSDDVFTGYVVVAGETIVDVGRGRAPERGEDCRGDLLLPGLIELHTDNLETHFVPRPRVEWHLASSVQSYDAQIATSGITTVFDSLRLGIDEHEVRSAFGSRTLDLAQAIADAQNQGLLRADHLTHIRAEVPAQDCIAGLEAFLARFPVQLISLMDHTPGQRQFRDVEKYFYYYTGKTGRSRDDAERVVAARRATGAARAAANRPRIVEFARTHGIALASHDDTTLAEVEISIREGVTLAEFPTTIEAAAASKAAGLAIIAGAPNVVRGGSHSGNVSARSLAEAGLLDILSSDYVPASLLLAALALEDVPAVGGLPGAIRLVSKAPAVATGLLDRGEIAAGKRADLIRVHAGDSVPVVRSVWRCGRRVA